MTTTDQLEISIAVTPSAFAKGWKSTETPSWSHLVARLMDHDIRAEKDGPWGARWSRDGPPNERFRGRP